MKRILGLFGIATKKEIDLLQEQIKRTQCKLKATDNFFMKRFIDLDEKIDKKVEAREDMEHCRKTPDKSYIVIAVKPSDEFPKGIFTLYYCKNIEDATKEYARHGEDARFLVKVIDEKE